MPISALILAADGLTDLPGGASRFPWRGEPMLQAVVRAVHGWPVDQVVVVLGDRAEEILETVDLAGSTVVIDEEWAEGSASSLRAGVDALGRIGEWAATIVTWGDLPGIDAGVPARLVAASKSARAVVPKYRYARGYPVLVAAPLWPRLLGLEGEADLIALLATQTAGVREVWVDALAPRRVLTPDDASGPTHRRRPE